MLFVSSAAGGRGSGWGRGGMTGRRFVSGRYVRLEDHFNKVGCS